MPHPIPFVRWCGSAAMVGGALWTMRETGALEGILMFLSLLL